MVIGWDYYTFGYPRRIPDGVLVLCSQSLLGIHNGEAWQIEAALSFALYNGYQYLLKSAGDIVIENPAGLDACLELIRDCDYLSTHAVNLDTRMFFGRVLPLYKIATAARANNEYFQIIEVQYQREAEKLNLRKKQLNHYESFGVTHLQPAGDHDRWGIGMELSRDDWLR